MNRRTFVKAAPAAAVMVGAASRTARAQAAGIVLPKPQKEGGSSVLAALWERKTIRTISGEPLPPQMLSNLLWAAFGVNRENGPYGIPGRTAATASNSQEIDLYVTLPEGIHLYEAVPHRLTLVTAGDHREMVNRNQRGAGGNAPVRIVYVADIAKYAKAGFQEPGLKDPEVQKSYYNVAAGIIAGNVYLFAASLGLAAWFHNCNREGLSTLLNLRPDQRVLFAQTVGYPSKT
jgi:hypothetical protein